MFLIIFFLLITSAILFIYTGPKLPPGTNDIIKEIQSNGVAEFSTGKPGFAKNGRISIYYECIGENKNGAVLLINGLGSTLLDWRNYIYEPLANAGFQVIRYDNRGLGKSDWVKDWNKKNAYTLEDMATDGLAVLDHLNIQKAHVVGMSMGGMIAQRLAISHKNRVLSLTSIMSTGYYYDPDLVNVPAKFLKNFIRYYIRYGLHRTEVNLLKMHVGIRKQLEGNGDYELDVRGTLEYAFYEIRKRNGYNKKVRDQHDLAIKKSGSRYNELPQLTIPTLIVHSTDDPLVKIEHRKKYAALIPHARKLFLVRMGHDLPRKYIGGILENMLINFAQAHAAIRN